MPEPEQIMLSTTLPEILESFSMGAKQSAPSQDVEDQHEMDVAELEKGLARIPNENSSTDKGSPVISHARTQSVKDSISGADGTDPKSSVRNVLDVKISKQGLKALEREKEVLTKIVDFRSQILSKALPEPIPEKSQQEISGRIKPESIAVPPAAKAEPDFSNVPEPQNVILKSVPQRNAAEAAGINSKAAPELLPASNVANLKRESTLENVPALANRTELRAQNLGNPAKATVREASRVPETDESKSTILPTRETKNFLADTSLPLAQGETEKNESSGPPALEQNAQPEVGSQKPQEHGEAGSKPRGALGERSEPQMVKVLGEPQGDESPRPPESTATSDDRPESSLVGEKINSKSDFIDEVALSTEKPNQNVLSASLSEPKTVSNPAILDVSQKESLSDEVLARSDEKAKPTPQSTIQNIATEDSDSPLATILPLDLNQATTPEGNAEQEPQAVSDTKDKVIDKAIIERTGSRNFQPKNEFRSEPIGTATPDKEVEPSKTPAGPRGALRAADGESPRGALGERSEPRGAERAANVESPQALKAQRALGELLGVDSPSDPQAMKAKDGESPRGALRAADGESPREGAHGATQTGLRRQDEAQGQIPPTLTTEKTSANQPEPQVIPPLEVSVAQNDTTLVTSNNTLPEPVGEESPSPLVKDVSDQGALDKETSGKGVSNKEALNNVGSNNQAQNDRSLNPRGALGERSEPQTVKVLGEPQGDESPSEPQSIESSPVPVVAAQDPVVPTRSPDQTAVQPAPVFEQAASARETQTISPAERTRPQTRTDENKVLPDADVLDGGFIESDQRDIAASGDKVVPEQITNERLQTESDEDGREFVIRDEIQEVPNAEQTNEKQSAALAESPLRQTNIQNIAEPRIRQEVPIASTQTLRPTLSPKDVEPDRPALENPRELPEILAEAGFSPRVDRLVDSMGSGRTSQIFSTGEFGISPTETSDSNTAYSILEKNLSTQIPVRKDRQDNLPPEQTPAGAQIQPRTSEDLEARIESSSVDTNAPDQVLIGPANQAALNQALPGASDQDTESQNEPAHNLKISELLRLRALVGTLSLENARTQNEELAPQLEQEQPQAIERVLQALRNQALAVTLGPGGALQVPGIVPPTLLDTQS